MFVGEHRRRCTPSETSRILFIQVSHVLETVLASWPLCRYRVDTQIGQAGTLAVLQLQITYYHVACLTVVLITFYKARGCCQRAQTGSAGADWLPNSPHTASLSNRASMGVITLKTAAWCQRISVPQATTNQHNHQLHCYKRRSQSGSSHTPQRKPT